MQDELKSYAGDELELWVTQALERMPEMTIPADFAARVAGRLPKRRARTMPALRTTRFGQIAAAMCLMVLLAAILVLAPRATLHEPLWVVLEWTLCGQFVLLAMWLGVWRRV